MKKVLAITTLIATSVFATGHASAESSKEENIGFATGAITGAAIGGPVGFVVGSALGVIFGDQVHKANQLDDANNQLAKAQTRESQLQEEIAMIQENLQLETAGTEAQWVTEGLTLNLMFTTNSAYLSDADRDNIDRIATIMKQFPELSLRLDGYSDPRGSKSDNLLLSQQRVDSVIDAFEAKGVQSDRLIGFAHGEVAGLETHPDMDAYAMARKVSVNFVTSGNSQLAQN